MKKTIVRAVSTAAFLSTVYAGSAYASEHTVQKGDSLWKIATKYQTTVSELKKLNNLNSDFLQVNQKLKVPAAAQPVITAVASKTASSTSVYVVKSGDYLGKISKQFNTTVKDLKALNGLNSDRIFMGQALKVPGKAKTTTPAPAVTSPVESTSTSLYTVVSGDTLSKIGLQYKMSVAELKKLNSLSSDRIYVGQKLKVRAKAVATTPPPKAPVKPTVEPAKTSAYIVKSGDTLGKISQQYKMTVQKLKDLNGLKSDMIYVGQKLKVSGESTVVTTPTPKAPVGEFATAFVEVAHSLIGTPYVWAGSTINGFDCSGLIYYAANQAGKEIGRTSAEGYYNRTFYVDQPQPGDLVFFENTYKKGISHVGIYIGGDQFIHADEKKGVSIANLSNPYYKAHFESFKRFY
ncbi:LysM peptidoglycan-binding domain-containing protein [Neobacillus sp. 179-C4.2 HS]|uniref:LysM peptidoglycan-binding domain-containing protein n=1 Tax=Neobacillus driksii TaxID=3035913 RepID=A0ABV4YYT3_9BACI|nr:peptidoglycan endopeptidase [Neobacillus sp. 179.-C4.2 HS]MDP5194595.1 LysM peptidoglycan-binding domain-containing protein [Neobacillus sp. 179.-C4.2 HS]